MARVCQVTPATVAHWIDQGHLKGHRTPTGHRRVESTDLVAFLKGHGMFLGNFLTHVLVGAGIGLVTGGITLGLTMMKK